MTTTTATRNAKAESSIVGPNAGTNELHSSSYRHSYHEMKDQHLVEVDVLEQLKANMSQLEDLHARLKFMMAEVAYLIKKP